MMVFKKKNLYKITILALCLIGSSCKPMGNVWDSVKASGRYSKNFVNQMAYPAVKLAKTTIKRTANVGIAAYKLAQGKTDQAVSCIGESLVNPLGTVRDLIKDSSGIVRRTQAAVLGRKNSKKIRICTIPLSQLAPKGHPVWKFRAVDFTHHVGIVIDDEKHGRMESMDHGFRSETPFLHEDQKHRYFPRTILQGNRNIKPDCDPVIMPKKMKEKEAVARVQCAQTLYWESYGAFSKYSLWNYNCGGWTGDVLKMAGLASPVVTNQGVGSILSTHSITKRDEWKKRKKLRSEIRKKCSTEWEKYLK